MNDLISIIVPVYNLELYVEDCINSLINQSHENIEIIIIDDGSIDLTKKKCESLASKDFRIKFVSKSNQGVSSARNYGLSISKGDYIAFVDGDDTCSKDMYEKLYKLILKTDTDLCVSTSIVLGDKLVDNTDIKQDVLSGSECMNELINMNYPSSLCTSLYTKSAIKGKILSEKIHFWEDFEYQFRVLKDVNNVCFCHEALYTYRQRENSANHQNISDKVLTCLQIPDLIYQSDSRSKSLYGYFILQVLVYYLRSDVKEKRYSKEIKKYIRRHLLKILKSDLISLKAKGSILLSSLDPNLLNRLV